MTQEHDDREILEAVRTIFEEKIPFNGVLGLKVTSLDHDGPTLELEMRDELVGNFYKGSLHGGVISSVLDVTGGLVAFLGVVRAMRGKSMGETVQRFSKMGTIDLRVDYLRPGLGKRFLATGYILRMGNRVAVTRMELTGDEDRLIAVGTGAYLVS
jgi:uncharacterized protein (TIGR00369 family)